MDFFASVFDNTDRLGAARSSESEDLKGRNRDFPFVDAEIVKGPVISTECS